MLNINMLISRNRIIKLSFLMLATIFTVGILIVTNPPALAAGAPDLSQQRTLRVGSQGEDVTRLQQRLVELGYSPGQANGIFGWQTYYAVIAFQKVNDLTRDGVAGPGTQQALVNPKIITARYSGDHIEVSKDYQVLLVVKNGQVVKIITASTGRRGFTTPTVSSPVFWKAGYKLVSRKYGGSMIWPSFFFEGIAVHGLSSVPPSPASHGCVRIPIPDSKYVYDNMPVGCMVYVY